MKTVIKPKKLGKNVLKRNLKKATELLARVQALVDQGKTAESPEMQKAIQDLSGLIKDVGLAQVLMKQALEKVLHR